MSNLNIEACRQPWESDEHWALRKEFLETFRPRFDVDRLLCLAQVYTNMELLGCSYPAPLMIQVRELAKELKLGSDLQQTRKARQNIPFVKEGSDRPAKRAIPENSTVHPQVKKVKLPDTNTVSGNYEINSNEFATSDANKKVQVLKSNTGPSICTKQTPIPKVETINSSSQLDKFPSSTNSVFADKLKKIKMLASKIEPQILCEEDGEWKCWTTLHKVSQQLRYSFECDVTTDHQTSEVTITLKLLDVILSKVTGSTKHVRRCKTAKKALKSKAAKEAVETLLHSAVKIVSDGENLMMKVGEKQVKKLSNSQVEGPSLTPVLPSKPATSCFPINPNCQFKVFPPDPKLQSYFCLFDSDVSSSSSPNTILNNSAQFCKITMKFDFEVNHGPPIFHICRISLKDNKICQAKSPTKVEAKYLACRVAVDSLSRIVDTIKAVNDSSDEFVVPRDQLFDCSDSSTILTETNIGCKMLKMMGWSGGGIGKEGNTGISEPVKASIGLQRGHGLGYTGNKNASKAGECAKPLRFKIESLLLDYAKSNALKDLVFANDFSADERKYIHRIANKYNLKSVSRGSGESRHLTIGRRLTWRELLGHLKRAGGSIGKYTLVTPQQYIKEHSEATSA